MSEWKKEKLPLTGRTIIDLGHQVRDLKQMLAEKDRLQNELLRMNQGLLSVALDTIEQLKAKVTDLECRIAYLAGFHGEPVPAYEVPRGDENAEPCDDEDDRDRAE